MDAPKCRKIPSCGKRHWGECGGGGKGEPVAKKKPAKPQPGDIHRVSESAVGEGVQKFALSGGNKAGLELLEELLARVEMLELAMDELLRGKRKRTQYMREYMRRRREEGKA